jgi:hypothetical protein
MHCELVIPGLFAGKSQERLPGSQERLPALELLLARGRHGADTPRRLERWLADAFDLGDAPLPAGALAAHDEAGNWVRADPVHLKLLRDRIVVVPAEAFALSREEAAALCEALNAHFGAAMEVRMLDARRWYARLAEPARLDDVPALEVAAQPVPIDRGRDARLTEIQMLLHGHAVNDARELPVNSLWLWGSGSIGTPSCAWRSVVSSEPLATGLARAAKARQRPLPPGAQEWLAGEGPEGRHLAVIDTLRASACLDDADEHARALAALERAWFAPLLEALRAGRIGMVSVHVPETGDAFETVRGDLRRFWRRARPVAAYA